MKLRATLIIVATLILFGSVYAIRLYQGRKAMAAMAAMAPQPPTVATATANAERWSGMLRAVATLQASQSVLVNSELAGQVRRIAFESGATIKRGDLLVELDTSAETAQLEGLEAAAKLTAANLQRARDLRAAGSNTLAELDAADAQHRQAVASVAQVKATIAKKRIVAPFSGKLGIRRVNLGEYLAAGAAIAMLENANPIYADFGLPQNELSHLRPGLEVQLYVDAFPERVFRGKVEAINPRVSDSTRMVTLRAVFDNADGALRGGMFGKVELGLSESTDVIVIPGAAVVYSSYGNFVYVVTPGPKGMNKVQQQFVTLGDRRGDQVAVLKGVKAGDQVVTAGQIKLRNDIPVLINNQVRPDNNPSPKPTES